MLRKAIRRGEVTIFGLSASAIVIGAVGLTGAAVFAFRQPREKIVKEFVETVGPKVIVYKDKPVPTPGPPPPPPTGSKEPEDARGDWDGVWRIPGQPVPMFSLRQNRSTFSGTFAPSWSATFPISYAHLRNGKLEFAVTDSKLSRYHFRMELLPSGDAKVVGWMKPEDALESLQRANMQAHTPQQAYVLRVWMEGEIARLGTITPIGTFRRVADPGKQTDSRMRIEANVKEPMGPSFIGKGG